MNLSLIRYCSVKGCGREAIYVTPRNLCQTHYVRLQRSGDVQEERPVGRPGPVPHEGCSISGCTSKHYAMGMCAKHYRIDLAARKGQTQDSAG